MYGIFLALFILIAIALIVLVLIQHGKGADIGAAFGSGASNTVFGSQGSSGFLFKLTGGLAAAFFVLALILGYMVNVQYREQSAAVLPLQTVAPVKKPVVPLPDDVLNDSADKNTSSSLSVPLEKTEVPQSNKQ